MKHPAKLLVMVLLILSCAGWVVTDHFLFRPTPVAFPIPKGWPAPLYDFSKNPMTKEGIALGRTLFYDPRLSKDGSLSCGSCHQQFGAFATYDHNLSHGFNNALTTRNAPGLFNLAWQKDFMWDGGINHLDLQPLAPITAPNEMAETLEHVLQKLRSDTAYRRLFKAAFGDATINTQRLTKALSQFVLSLVSSNSKYDRVKSGTDTFILPEKLGYAIFQQKCVQCHAEPFFTDGSFRNTGLPIDPVLKDLGRMQITGNATDSLKFRVPSLRNVMRTFPYGHDGRLFSIYSVLDHYRKTVQAGPTTDSLLKKGLPLSNFEIGQLTAFLYTLTDSSFLQNPRFAPPGNGPSITAPVDRH